jgi:hypothetical protein
MRIDYCPICGKAGLRYENTEGKDANGLTRQELWAIYPNPLPIPHGSQKYCPRCNRWIEPCNKPYIGVKTK